MLWQVFLLSLLPISEVRGAIPVGIASNDPVLLVLIIAIIGNVLIIPLVYIFLNSLHKLFLKVSWYHKLFHKYIERNRHKLENAIGKNGEFFALFLFTAIPLPFTGAYSATVLSWVLGVSKKKTFVAVGSGVVVASLIVLLFSLGIFSVF